MIEAEKFGRSTTTTNNKQTNAN
ncbi:uncharacterized protein METZ01_LOCUS463963 [marine metagenome]|uniref:Uncharacterized protein n=1 Tax=marine metagenome TaxID=408172 RepID=A0A383AUA6_9ZZZZ